MIGLTLIPSETLLFQMKSIDRVIALDESSTSGLTGKICSQETKSVFIRITRIVFNSVPDSTTVVDESDQEFRSRVEKIRQLGGDTWLTMLGEIQSEDTNYSKVNKTDNNKTMFTREFAVISVT
jgi:hypothetical protein